MWLLYGGLTSTSQGSILVSTSRLTSYNPMEPIFQTMPPLPQPDWALLSEPNYSYQTQEQSKKRQEEFTISLHHAKVLLTICE